MKAKDSSVKSNTIQYFSLAGLRLRRPLLDRAEAGIVGDGRGRQLTPHPVLPLLPKDLLHQFTQKVSKICRHFEDWLLSFMTAPLD